MISRAIYVWIGANNIIRWKIKTIHYKETIFGLNTNICDYPKWNFDGSSTGQASGVNTEVQLFPVKVYKFPYDDADVIVLCETYNIDDTPHLTNKRYTALEKFKRGDDKPWFGLEVEYFIYDPQNPEQKLNGNQTSHYCGFNGSRATGKIIALEHYNKCLEMGLQISGMNAEVTKGQWEFQIGPSECIDSGDHTTIAKFMLIWIAEHYGRSININDSKPYEGVNGSGCHVNFSTVETRENNDLPTLTKLIDKLAVKHEHHMSIYGDNSKRMTGTHETAASDVFTHGVGTRHTSVRIPNLTKEYFEDRRPSSNIDYYEVTSTIYETCYIN